MTGSLALARRETTARLRMELDPGYQPDILLPWPPRSLSPNERVHWAVKSRVTLQYKTACYALLQAHKPFLRGQYKFTITFCPPDNRRRDADNIISAFKAGQDALSLVTGVDDSKFVVTYARGPVTPQGAVRIAVTA